MKNNLDKAGLQILEQKAAQIRWELLQMFSHGKAHHFGGSLSCVELVTALYFYKMNYTIDNCTSPDRDRFIMSKGHSVPTQYVTLALLGIIPIEELPTIKQIGTRLQGHPDIKKLPWLEAPTGSLGQGLSYANGIALAARLDGLRFNIFLILGDGELQEGQIWEAAMTTSHYRLTNVCVIVDRNKFQSQGEVDCMMGIEPLLEKLSAFGWRPIHVNGHNFAEICQALDLVNGMQDRPIAIVADTLKGKGISFMENTFKYHNFNLPIDQYKQAEKEIKEKLSSFDRS